MSVPGVFLDRDGVLNDAVVTDGRPRPPGRPQDVVVPPGARRACRALAAAGLRLIGVTNQPDIARGRQTPGNVAAINELVRRATGVEEIVTCPHDDADGCACRKPRPGMILEAAHRWDIDLTRSVTVGDRWRDVDAGRAAGTRTVFIDRRYAEPRPATCDLTVDDLEESVPWIIETLAARP